MGEDGAVKFRGVAEQEGRHAQARDRRVLRVGVAGNGLGKVKVAARAGVNGKEIKPLARRFAAKAELMRTAHPDAGGSDWLAARVNMARDVLLGPRHA